MADDEIRFVCWCGGGLRRNKGEIGSSGVISESGYKDEFCSLGEYVGMVL